MPVHVEVGNGDVIEFPDGIDESKMLEVVRKHHQSSQPDNSEQIAELKRGIAEAGETSKRETLKANIFDTAAKSLDVSGMFHSLINQPNRLAGLPDMPPIVTPEAGAKIAKFFDPINSSAGSTMEGVEKGVGDLISSATDPDLIAQAALAKKFPMPVARVWQGQMIGAIPEATKRVLESKDASEAARSLVGLGATTLIPAGIEKGINRPIKTGVLPSESGVSEETLNQLGEEAKAPEAPAKPEVVQDTQEIITAAETRKGLPEKIAADVDTMPLEEFAAWKKEADRTGRLADKQPAYSLGEKAPDQAFVDSLKAKAEKWAAKAKELLPADLSDEGSTAKFNEAQIAGQKAQFFREAYERATGTGSAVVGEPGYEAPFPSKPIAKFGGYQFGGTVPQWEIVDKTTGRTRHVSAETARAKGFEPEKAPEKPVVKDSLTTEPAKPNARLMLDRPVKDPWNDEHSVSIQINAVDPSGASNAAIRDSLPPELKGKLVRIEKLEGEIVPTNKALSIPASIKLTFPDKATAQKAIDHFKGATDSKGRTPERQKLLSDMAAKVKEATATEGALPAKSSAQALGITPGGQAVIKAADQMLKSLRNKLVNSWATRGNKSDIARTKDAADNQAKIFASQQGRAVKLEATKTFGPVTDQALKAIVPMIESGGDRAKLSHFVTQASGKHFEAMRAARFALRNFNRLQPLAAKVKALHDAQIAEENANGINTTFRENYIKHAFDVDKLPNRGEEFFGGAGGAGTKSGFKAARKFETIYDAIEAGYGDAIKSLDSAKLTESRIASGQQLINDRQWVNSFRGTTDPTTKKPLISDVTFDKNYFPIAPPGYDAVTVLPGQFVAVHNGYRGIFDAVTGGSKLAQGEVGGLPVGKAMLNTAAGIKHGLLLFDTFHASRIMQKQFFLTGKVGYGKGLSLLDYNASDLAEAVRQGEITQEMADYARTNKPTAQLLLKEGLNVGRIQEALRSDIIRNLPVVGTFNKWVFDKVTRGAMMESALHEFDRTKAQDPTVPDRKVAAIVAKKINVTFGNIGRQGLLRSRTMQDVSRMAMLAPQWVESMARSEIGGILELGKVPIDLAAGRGLQVGTLGKTMAGGLLAYIAGTQLLNLATRGHLTFQNEEEGHKLDAWIPDLSGKTPGYFLNPLAVVAELTHDAYRYAFKKDDAVSIAVQIARNKASPMARSVGTLWNGKDYKGEKIAGSWNKIAAAGAALAPTPIPVAGFRSDQPGQAQRQITASLGVKTEPAPGPRQQLGELHSKWMANNPDPKLRHDFERRQKEEFVLDYKPLDIALRSGDEKGAADALATLRKTHSDKAIFQRMNPTDSQGVSRPLFHGSHETEMKFRRTLTPEQRALYERARTERKRNWDAFRKVWGVRPGRE